MKELGEALKLIFDKVAGFFDIFDLSFLVSGASIFAAIVLWLKSHNYKLDLGSGLTNKLLIILICYVFWLLSFSVGRRIRQVVAVAAGWLNSDYSRLRELITDHGIEKNELIRAYFERETPHALDALYYRLWAELRQDQSLAPSLTFINRFWVMTATYDGLAASLLVWIFVLAELMLLSHIYESISWQMSVLVLSALTICFMFCLYEATQYLRGQINELLATISARRK